MDSYERRVAADAVWFISHGCADFGLRLLRTLAAEQQADRTTPLPTAPPE